MRFLVDAQLSYRLKKWLVNQGHDAVHTDDLLQQHLTPDSEIVNVAENENRIIISKDSGFYKLSLIKGVPQKLLFITTGNIVNKDLIRLFELNFSSIEQYFNSGGKIIELDNNSITAHS